MNRHCNRIIFNRARGLFMAVPEGAALHSSGSACPCRKASASALLYAAVAATAAACALLCCGIAQAQIVADPGAPGGQRPTVLVTPNGAPLVNIQTPSAAGVSRNTYRRFDVNGQGAVLNNSRTAVQSQIGGWVQGNPWLSRGSARVILNEVNASDPSYLRGALEVTMSKEIAEKVIPIKVGNKTGSE